MRAAILLLVYAAAATLAYWAGADAPWAHGTDRALGSVAVPASALAGWVMDLIPDVPNDLRASIAALAVVVAPAVAATGLAAAAVAPKILRVAGMLAFVGVLAYGYASMALSPELSAAVVVIVLLAAAVPVYLVAGAPVTLLLTAAAGIWTGRLVIAALHGTLSGMGDAGETLQAWLGPGSSPTAGLLVAALSIAPALACIGVIRRR